MGAISRVMGMFKARPGDDVPKKDVPISPNNTVGKSKETRVAASYSTGISVEQALKHPVGIRCVQKLATAVQTVEWVAEKDPNSKVAADESTIEALNKMLRDPNANMTAQMFRYWMTVNMALRGRCLFKVSKNALGIPQALYPLDSQALKRTLNKHGEVEKYTYGLGKDAQTSPSRITAKNHEAFVYEWYNPSISGAIDSDVGVNVLSALGLPTQIITLLMQRAVDTADGHPNSKYVLTAERALTDDQKKAVSDFLDGYAPGSDDSGKILFLYNTTVEVHKLDNDLSDIHSKVPVDDMTRMIAGLFGIPVALMGLGAADGSKFAGNYVESRLTFWEDTIVPYYLNPGQAALTKALCPEGIRIRFLLDSIPALQAGRASLAKEHSTVGFLTKNEKRAVLGYEPREDGDEFDILNQIRTVDPSTGKTDAKKSDDKKP